MKSFLKLSLKFILTLCIAAIFVLVLAFISGVRNPINSNIKEMPSLETYESKRSEEETKEMQQSLALLAKTGACAGCNFITRRNEQEKKDLYEAIQSAKNKGLAIDLSGAELFFQNLAGVDLSGANLSGANLLGANLKGANLSRANLRDANLDAAKLQGANLRGTDLTRATLGIANLSDADLTDAIMHAAVLSCPNLYEANLTNVDLTDAAIYNPLLNNTKFVGADLRGARIIADFSKNADFTDAKFDGWIVRSFNTLTLWLLLIKTGV